MILIQSAGFCAGRRIWYLNVNEVSGVRFQVSVSKVQRFWVQGFKGYGLDSTAFDRLHSA
jgi:hypothetical protein